MCLLSCSQDQTRTAEKLIETFGSSCRVNGEWNQIALEQTKALKASLETLKELDSCKGVVAAIQNLNLLIETVTSIKASSTLVAHLEAKYHKQEIILSLLRLQDRTDLSPPDHLSLETSLRQTLLETEVELAQTQANRRAYGITEDRENLARGLLGLQQFLNGVFSAQANLEACAAGDPLYLAMQLGAGGLAIAGSFLEPALGAAVILAAQAFQGIVKYARNSSVEEGLLALRSAEMPTAFSCVLQKISETSCSASDLARLNQYADQMSPAGQFQAFYPEQEETRQSQWFWQGLNLWVFKVQGLLDWISLIANGGDPVDPADSARRRDPEALERTLREIYIELTGTVNKLKRTIRKAPKEQLETETRHGIGTLAGTMAFFGMTGTESGSSSTAHNPLVRFNWDYRRILFKLAQGINRPPPANLTQQDDSNTVELKPIGLTFDIVVERAFDVLSEVESKVRRELGEVRNPFPGDTLEAAKKPSRYGNFSPYDVLLELIEYFRASNAFYEQMATKFTTQRPEFELTMTRIQQMIDLLEYASEKIHTWSGNHADNDAEARYVINDLYDKFNATYGSSFIGDRIFNRIKWDLYARLYYDEAPKDLERILRASSRDITALLVQNVQDGTYAENRLPLSNAISTSMTNLDLVVQKLFPKSLQESLVLLQEEALRWNFNTYYQDQALIRQGRTSQIQTQGTRGPWDVLSNLCLLILTTSSQWPEQVNQAICSQAAVLEPSRQNGNMISPLEFRKLAERLKRNEFTPTEKVCIVRDFFRNDRLLRTRFPKNDQLPWLPSENQQPLQ